MADNTPIKNASAATENIATDELSDSAKSPKVTLLDGTGSPTPVNLVTGLAVVPKLNSAGHTSVQTSATGATYVAFASQACKQLTIVNDTGTKLEARQAAAGVALRLPDGSIYTFYGLANASELDLRRADTSNTQVTATARWEA